MYNYIYIIMESMLNKLQKTLELKDMFFFWCFPNDETFKIIKKEEVEIQKYIKKHLKKYKNSTIASVRLIIEPRGLKSIKSPSVFFIKIRVFEINEKGNIGEGKYTSWSYTLSYTPKELKEHPFKISQIEKLTYLVNEKILVSLFDESYTNCKKHLERKKKELGIE